MKLLEQWAKIVERIEILKGYDRRFYHVGARDHKYVFNPPCPQRRLQDYEIDKGFTLPDELHFVYSKIGNGGAGPDWGLWPIERWVPRQPEKPWILKDYDVADQLTGVISIMHRYPSYDNCIVCNGGQIGKCVGYDNGAVVTNPVPSLAFEYSRWLDEDLEPFEVLTSLADAGANTVEIVDQLLGERLGRRTFVKRVRCLRLLASYLDIGFDPNDERAHRRDGLDIELQKKFDEALNSRVKAE